jgi:hypothetical protein
MMLQLAKLKNAVVRTRERTVQRTVRVVVDVDKRLQRCVKSYKSCQQLQL